VYLVVIAWIYVALMMAVAEANHPVGTVLGAVFTFVLYGVGPVALLIYLMGRPARRAARHKREAAETLAASAQPDGSGEPAADAVPPVRKEP
jgi:Kef-type K+ transport system membrane component KefB